VGLVTYFRVAIVRPYRSPAQLVGAVVGRACGVLLNAWLLMLILGAITTWHFGYGKTLFALSALYMVQRTGPLLTDWTHAATKAEKR
jgi:hypothetical protein